MIDIHAHILPGIDDGSENMEASIQMAKIAVESGVNFMIATPHYNCSFRGNFMDTQSYEEILHRYGELVKALEIAQVNLDVALGMEVYATEEVPDLIAKGRLITLNRSRYLLLEFNFREDVALSDFLIDELTNQGISPIIAHPERYPFVQKKPEMVYDWLGRGCFLQLNKGSILGNFGHRAYDTATFFLDHKLASLIASDAHGATFRTTDMAKVYDYVSKTFTKEYADLLMMENPKRILENQELIHMELSSGKGNLL